LETLEQIIHRISAAVPGAQFQLLPNDSPSGQRSLLVDREHAAAAAVFLRDDPQLRLDYLSNVTGVDWLDRVFQDKVRVVMLIDGVQKEVEQTVQRQQPGYLEVLYHLYSMSLGHGPVVLRMRTPNRSDTTLPSLTPVWRGAELQEREVYDLYGVVFDGHPDLRRLLMWDGFTEFPMRKDYVEPDDYEWEPTAHDDVSVKAQRHRPHPSKP
jgi:NADH-quinone oxidoreductase subunit C